MYIFTKRATSIIAHDEEVLHPGFTEIPDYEGKLASIGKSPDTYCPIGPVAVPKERLPEKETQRVSLLFSIPNLVSTLSQGQTIQPGDTIATGTPYGVGFGFLKFLKAGDEVKVSVTGLGLLRVQASTSIPTANLKARGNNGLVEVGSKHLFYQFQGQKDGAPVICIHGLGGSSSYFTPLLDKLSTTHALHFTDFEGHGLSPTSASAASNLLGPLRLLSPRPEATGASRAPKPSEPKGMVAVADAVVNAGLWSKTKSSDPLAVTTTKLSSLSQDPEGYAKACMALARSAEETLDVEKVAAKTLILTGTADAVSPPALCEKYGQQIKNSKVVVLDDVAHWHLFEDVEGVRSEVYQFLGV
ncbi:hypothetical protein BDW75DRAFT_228321 [Aspergillus navahoensis]